MKKLPAKTRARSHQLQSRDLAAVRGGDNGAIVAQVIVVVGVTPQDNGVIHLD
jgi:hypothetical protein